MSLRPDQRWLAHRAVDRLFDALPQALEDHAARGYPRTSSGGTRRSGGRSSTTESAALTDDLAARWLTEADAIARRTIFLANIGVRRWPPPPKRGARHAGVLVGEHDTDAEICTGCGLAVLGGHADPIRRIDGKPYHKSPCWYRASRGPAEWKLADRW